MFAIRIFSRGHVKNLLSLPRKLAPTRPNSGLRSDQMKKMKIMQATMQCDDGVPVYLKRGKRDQILFRLTCFLIVIGNIEVLRLIWRGAKKL